MTLLSFLKSENDARKIFGRRELAIIEKQIWGIDLTQSEKNRLSRDIRRKLAFIGKACRFSEEFELKKGAEAKRIINQAKEVILSDSLGRKASQITVYGSYVSGGFNHRSDIDLAVDIPQSNIKEATLFRKRILGQVHDRLDIQVFSVLPLKIQKEIQAKGKVIYKNEN